jgi:hypothetical protein
VTDESESARYELRVWRDGEHVSTEVFSTFDEMDARLQQMDRMHAPLSTEYRVRAYVGDAVLGEITNR